MRRVKPADQEFQADPCDQAISSLRQAGELIEQNEEVTDDESHRDDAKHAADEDDEKLAIVSEASGKLSAMATAARMESIEKARSVSVTDVTVPQKLHMKQRAELTPFAELSAEFASSSSSGDAKWAMAR